MKKLHLDTKNEVVSYQPNGTCYWCKISGLEVFYSRHSSSSMICRNCAREVLKLFRMEGKIPDQVSMPQVGADPEEEIV